MKRLISILAVAAVYSTSLAAEENLSSSSSLVAVEPLCESRIPMMCQIYFEYLRRDPNYVVVSSQERARRSDAITAELSANRLEGADIEGQIDWWRDSAHRNTGRRILLKGVSDDPKSHLRLVFLALAGSGMPASEKVYYLGR